MRNTKFIYVDKFIWRNWATTNYKIIKLFNLKLGWQALLQRDD